MTIDVTLVPSPSKSNRQSINQISQYQEVQGRKKKGLVEEWVAGQHEGVAEGVCLVVDAVMALLHADDRTAPLLLVLGAPTPDTALALTLAADYLGIVPYTVWLYIPSSPLP